jgi:hypothetical protein
MRYASVGVICAALAVACGGGPEPSHDAAGGGDAPPGSDAPPGTPDAPPGGVTCASYCAAVMDHCSGVNVQYASVGQCLAACGTWEAGDPRETHGNTLACHDYHAGQPAINAPEIHCIHAGPGGGTVCGTLCVNYCNLVQTACTGADQLYATDQACRNACAGFPTTPDYSANVTSGDSLACRVFYAAEAAATPASCPSAGADSTACD